MTSLQAIRGMNDLLPQDIPYWHRLEQVCRQLMQSYGYQEIRTPVLELTALFKRSVGEVTDIVEKEMYTFEDRNGESVSLRPEGTAGAVRAGIEHGLLYNQVQRWWYMGPMFRHERPQKGRYRQFQQLGAEIYGMDSPLSDVELMLLSYRLWKYLEIADCVVLEVNTLGTSLERQAYRQQLVDYFSLHPEQLDEESKRRLLTNPLRILDSKNPAMQPLLEAAPQLLDSLGEVSRQRFNRVCALLGSLKIPYRVNTRLVRGLDYYCHTVFEWITDRLGAQGAICAGGRYDDLVAMLGAKPTPAVGFAMGLERIVLLLQSQAQLSEDPPDVYGILLGEEAESFGLNGIEQLRDALPALKLKVDCGGGSYKSQFKRADKSGAKFALVIGADEVARDALILKPLREDSPQEVYRLPDLIKYLSQY